MINRKNVVMASVRVQSNADNVYESVTDGNIQSMDSP